MIKSYVLVYIENRLLELRGRRENLRLALDLEDLYTIEDRVLIKHEIDVISKIIIELLCIRFKARVSNEIKLISS